MEQLFANCGAAVASDRPVLRLLEFPLFRFKLVPCWWSLLTLRQTVDEFGTFRCGKDISNNFKTSWILFVSKYLETIKTLFAVVSCGIAFKGKHFKTSFVVSMQSICACPWKLTLQSNSFYLKITFKFCWIVISRKMKRVFYTDMASFKIAFKVVYREGFLCVYSMEALLTASQLSFDLAGIYRSTVPVILWVGWTGIHCWQVTRYLLTSDN